MSFLSHRLSRIKPSPTLAITAQAAALKAQGVNIISLGAGEPDFDTPSFIRDATITAIKAGRTKYTAVEGTRELRQAIAEKFSDDNGINYTPEQIIVGAGAKQVIFNAFLASLNPGDEILIPSPYWVSYPEMVEIAGGTPRIVSCLQDVDFKLTPQVLSQAITPRTKWLILNSPSNPTGMVYTQAELEELAAVLRQFPHVHVLSDDIYEYLVYDSVIFYTLAQVAPDLKERILTVNGFSKSYSMTGWRIGYGAGQEALIKAITILQSQSTSNACSLSQDAALAALEGPQDFRKEWVKVFTERRDKILEIFKNVPGLICFKPQGAFYLYIECAGLMGKKTSTGKVIATDTDLAAYLLETAQVAVVPGIAFGLSPYFRISYATATELLEEACHRITTAIKGLL